MCADKPLELLQPAGVPDEHVLGHGIEFFGGVDALAEDLDDTGIDQVDCAQMGLDSVAADRIVVPGPVSDDRLRSSPR
jgi:hypothetical protein